MMHKYDYFLLGMWVGGVLGIFIHAYLTGTLFVN